MATHSLLEPVVRAAKVAVVDPAIVIGTLHAGGHDPARLDAVARQHLVKFFAVEMVARPEMMAYDIGTRTPPRAVAVDFEGPARPRSLVQSFSLIMRRVDLRDGATSLGGDVHVQHRDRIGWFGNVDDTSLLRRLQQASESLWNEFRAHLEDT